MLTRTFMHISGVGPKREMAFWKAGVHTWDDFMARGRDLLPAGLYNLALPVVGRSLEALHSPGGLADLAAMLPSAEHWRFYPTYGRVAYLDIETGDDPDEWGGVTVVGVYDGQNVTQYVAGRDLREAAAALSGYDVVVTFAGSSFDLPVLRKVFTYFYEPPVHIDLRWVLRRLGYRGGLKRIEKTLGLDRPGQVDGLSGFDAVRLWREHLWGSPDALDTLLEYNACDIVNLAPLLELACRELRALLLGRAGLA